MPLAVMGRPTGDHRQFEPGALDHLALPLPFRYVAQDVGGHAGARVVGRMHKIDYAEDDGTPVATGEFFDGDDAPEDTRKAAQEALYLAKKGVIGPSVDLDSAESEVRQVKPKTTVAQAAANLECGCNSNGGQPSEVQVVKSGRLRGATLAHIAAFAELANKGQYGSDVTSSGPGPDPNVTANAAMTLEEFVAFFEQGDVTDDEAYAVDKNVGGGVDREKIPDEDFVDPAGRRFPIVTPGDISDAVHSYGRAKPLIPMDRFKARLTAIAKRKGASFEAALPESWGSLTASAVATFPATALDPPAEWFDDPKLTGPTPLTITDDGRVFGHLATWGTCHTGINNACIRPPKSRTGYAYFHTGELVAGGGRRVPVGRLTYGGGHAKPHAGYAAAAEHYDATSAVGAYVRAGEDEHGIWVAGAMEPTASRTTYRTMRSSPLSGDWRRVAGNLELVAALHVNTAGFPIPRSVMASGEVYSLTAAGALHVAEPTSTAPGYLNDPGMPAYLRALVRDVVKETRAQEARQADVLAASAAMRELADEARRERYAEAQMTMAALAAGVDGWEVE